MKDQFGRIIDYIRLSLTDRCNLRCRYCMPNGIALESHDDMLTYEEMLRICRLAVALGITSFKITGGEPLVRRGCADFIASLKSVPGVREVTVTTNGLYLHEHLRGLARAGIDGINISLDTLDASLYRELTGVAGADVRKVVSAIGESVSLGIKTKVNAVLLEECFDELVDIAGLAERMSVDVRFIELMPIGEGTALRGVPMRAAFERLRERWGDLKPICQKRGNGPARYYASKNLTGCIGFIDAVSHGFCRECNRVRLTASGELKPCLCYDMSLSVRDMLRSGAPEEEICEAMRGTIAKKPLSHCFSEIDSITERKTMNRIGG